MTETQSNQAPRLLVPLDGSPLAEQAIPYASALAGSDGSILFLQVTPETEPIYGFLGNLEATRTDVDAAYAEAAGEELSAAQERWKPITPTTETLVVAGNPADVILQVATDHQCSMIVMASHGRGAVGRWTYGSVADRVARTAAVPVMIVRPQDATPDIALPIIRRILVPLDGSDLSNEAVPIAAHIAKHLGISIVLLNIINPARALAPYPSMAASYPPEIHLEIEEEMRSAAQKWLDDIVHTLREQGIDTKSSVDTGSAAHSIVDWAEPGDIIIMTSHGRSGIRRWLIGSVAEQLVRNAPVPVMIVRSKGQE